MRRKKRFGVYTNRTVKKFYCSWDFWDIDNGPWKIDEKLSDYSRTNYKGAWHSIRKAHKEGFGPTLPGKKFIIYNTRNYSPPIDEMDLPIKHLMLKKQIKAELKESVEEFFFLEDMSSIRSLKKYTDLYR